MLAGVLGGSGYYMGSNLWPASEANPKGFFEDLEINYINELLLVPVTPRRPRGPLGRLYRSRPVQWQRWLAVVSPGTEITLNPDTETRIEREVARAPFCFKDPRFCYTLPAWRRFVGDAAFLCIFRSPAETVTSILKDCAQAPYLADLRMTRRRALAVWNAMYRSVLDVHRSSGDWLFVHYDQVLDGSAAPQVEELLGQPGNWGFPEASLRRSAAEGPSSVEAEQTYRQLCLLAGYESAGLRTNGELR